MKTFDINCDEIGDEFLPHPDICGHFILCINGKPEIGQCPPGYIIDIISRNCVEGECESESSEETPPDTPPTDETTTPTTTTRDPNIEDGIECPENQAENEISFLPSQIDCRRYYVCINSRPYVMECREGLHWNQNIEACDFEESAKCFVRYDVMFKMSYEFF